MDFENNDVVYRLRPQTPASGVSKPENEEKPFPALSTRRKANRKGKHSAKLEIQCNRITFVRTLDCAVDVFYGGEPLSDGKMATTGTAERGKKKKKGNSERD